MWKAFRMLLRPVRMLAELATDAASPRHIAWGIALGMMVGLVPKGNLTAWVLAAVVLATRANLGAAALSTFVFSWLGMLVDPLTHRLGLALLTSVTLRPFWDGLYGLPLMPWMRLHNTVVLGNLLLGLALLLPAYAASLRAVERLRPWVADQVERWRLKHGLAAADTVTRWSIR
jgi:uncharacterized protein (TIGR03546 family)